MPDTRDLSIGERIRFYRKRVGMTQQELADYLGLKKAVISKYENGTVTNLKRETLKKMSELFDIEPWELQWGEVIWAEEDEKELVKLLARREKQHLEANNYIRIPVLGRVAAGVPIEQIEDIEDYEEIKAPTSEDKEYFALRIRGDSMQPKIWDGSIVIAKKQEDAETGDIIVATVNGNDAVCKQLKHFPGGIMLVSLNPAYEPMIFEEGDVNSLPVRILGKVIEVRTSL